jgi:hypothetical protein
MLTPVVELSAWLKPLASASGRRDHLMKTTLALVAAMLCAGVAAGGADAQPRYSKALQQACANDYRRLCGEYGIETEALRLCMDRKGKSLTKVCVDAMVADGEVSRAEVQRRGKSGH